MAQLKGSKTHDNLKHAFAGESQANRRYLYFAKQADIEGYPYREIAEMMGTPVGTVMSRLHRGRKKIREQLMASGFGTPRAESSGA